MNSKLIAAVRVVNILNDNDYRAYLAGGCVRDMVIGREPKDYDVATSATPEQVETLFPESTAVGKSFGVVIVKIGNESLEVATFRTESAYSDRRHPDTVTYAKTGKEDVQRRDFTMNGLLLNQGFAASHHSIHMHVLDYVGGVQDIKHQIIRCIGNPEERIAEDALRMLRAIRFAVQLGFVIEENTWKAIRANHKLIENVSRERVRDEFLKMLESPNPARAIYLLYRSNLFEDLFGKDFNDVLPDLLHRLDWAAENGFFRDIDMLAMIGSCVDTTAFHFFVNGLKLSNDETEQLFDAKFCVAYMANLAEASPAEVVTFLRRKGSYQALAMYQAMAATCDTDPSSFYVEKITAHIDKYLHLVNTKPFITGDDLIAAGMTPGSSFRSCLSLYEYRQLNGEFLTREDALADLNKEKQSNDTSTSC